MLKEHQHIIDQIILNFPSLNLEIIQYLLKQSTLKEVKKKEIYIEAGTLDKNICIILKGMIRVYYVVNGEEKNIFFISENSTFACYESIILDRPTNQYVDAIEDTLFLQIPHQAISKLEQSNINMSNTVNIWLKAELVQLINRIERQVLWNVEQHYLYLLEENPELLARIPQKHLASYLGITPESLSRIRARITKKGRK